MMRGSFEYIAPASVPEAVAALANTAWSKPLAGGQRLLHATKFGRETPPLLVDLRRIEELRGIARAGDGQYRVGALTTLDALGADAELANAYPALVEAARAVGDPQVRNRATVGGCVATGREASDLAAPLLVAGATLAVAGPGGDRQVSVEELYQTDRATLAAGEIITAVELSAPRAGLRGAYERVADLASSAPICGVAVAAAGDGRGRLTELRIAVTGATSRPTRLVEAELALVGTRAPGQGSGLPVGPMEEYLDDARASAGYRAHLVGVLIGRAVTRAANDLLNVEKGV